MVQYVSGLEDPTLVDDIALLEFKLFGDEAWSLSQIRSHWECGHSIMVALKDGCLCGYLLGISSSYEAEIYRIGVDPFFQRSSIGRSLLKLFEEVGGIKQVGGCIFLEVKESNKAVHFYKSEGFTIYNRREEYYVDENALLMKKSFAQKGGV